MQNSIFCVNDEPYCVWDIDLLARNREFLKGFDPHFFEYSTAAHIESEDEKRASVALRLGLHHALETFFSLVGAYVQAPDCLYAWLAKCQTPSLRYVTSRIQNGDSSLFTKQSISDISWSSVSQSVHLSYLPDTERQKQTVDGFARLWQYLAREFLDASHVDEYNSLKHGFRLGAGCFKLEIAAEPADGTPPAPNDFKLLGKSDFGSSYFKIEPLTGTPGERSLTVSPHSNNWSLEKVVLLNQATYISINNVVSALRIANGFPAGECMFLRPQHQDDFLKPWQYSPGVTNMHWKSAADASNCRSLSKHQLLETLAALKDG